MTYKGYTGVVGFEEEDRIFHGRVVDLLDVITFQGASVDELEQAFRESVDAYLSLCEELGREPEKPFSGRFVLRMDSETHRKLHVRAEQLNDSINNVVLRALEKELG